MDKYKAEFKANVTYISIHSLVVGVKCMGASFAFYIELVGKPAKKEMSRNQLKKYSCPAILTFILIISMTHILNIMLSFNLEEASNILYNSILFSS